MSFPGTCNTEVFNTWVEKALIKALKPGQTVILDTASFHKSKRTQELIDSGGCKLLFLPPHSLDYNPIEKFWAKMKTFIEMEISESLFQAIAKFFLGVRIQN
jgi:transposase